MWCSDIEFYKRHYTAVFDILHFSFDSVACTVFYWFVSLRYLNLLQVV